MRLSFALEEVLHQLATFVFKDATGYCTFRMQGAGRIVAIAAFLVAAAIDNTRYLAPAKGSGTHHAGLHGDVEGAVSQLLAA